MGIFTTPIPEFWLVIFPFLVNHATLQNYCKWTLFVQQNRYLARSVNLRSTTCNTWLSTHLTFWCWLDEALVGYYTHRQGHSQMYCLYKAHVNMNKWFEEIYNYKQVYFQYNKLQLWSYQNIIYNLPQCCIIEWKSNAIFPELTQEI